MFWKLQKTGKLLETMEARSGQNYTQFIFMLSCFYFSVLIIFNLFYFYNVVIIFGVALISTSV